MQTATAAQRKSGEEDGHARRLLVIDDDELCRELVCVISGEAGWAAEPFPSGEAALEYLKSAGKSERPLAVLTDLQMPGLSGEALALRLRALCGPGTVLLAMSASAPGGEAPVGFDGFLRKPFSGFDLKAALPGPDAAGEARETPLAESVSASPILSESIYENLARSLPPAQLAALYALCVADAERRIGTMRRALAEQDDQAFRGCAHAIKGGCAMVGALELERLAAKMEEEGIPPGNGRGPDPATPCPILDDFVAACARLKRMLDLEEQGHAQGSAVDPSLS